jgi:cytochrome c biogenesis protein ResB
MRLVDAYYSNELRCWVRMERQADGEWCHTSGYATRADALEEV